MKIISNGDRAKIFALYWEQEGILEGPVGRVTISEVIFPKYYETQSYHLLLKPLSQIADRGCCYGGSNLWHTEEHDRRGENFS